MNRRRLGLLACGLLMLGASGCVRESVDGTTATFTYALWVPLLTFVAGVAAVPAGWFLPAKAARAKWFLLLFGPLLALFFAPVLLGERAIVSDHHFSSRSGFWGFMTTPEIRYSDLRQVRIVTEEKRQRRGGKRTYQHLECVRNDGTSEIFNANNAVTQAAALAFLEKMSALGIPVREGN